MSLSTNKKAQVKDSVSKAQPKLVDYFIDTTDVGRKSHNKFELSEYELPDSNYVVIRFYSKQNNQWQKRNEYHFPKYSVIGCDPQTSDDFNNDGLNDVTYISDQAGRLANEIRTLFIYDNKNDSLIYIKNSSDYPNMLYNRKLNCIDAFLVSGCTVTAFLKLEKDTLREFASVSQCDSLIVSTYDKKGNEKVILRKKGGRGDFVRYKNYRPLDENDEE